jgi:DNA-binding MarR family transcriptional regulator
MPPDARDVRAMVGALFSLIGSLERATRRSKGASTLGLLQVIGDRGRWHPSEIAERQRVNPSLVTHQLHELESLGYVRVVPDPHDGRFRLVQLTPSGTKEMGRLREVGVDRLALFVRDWTKEEVRTLTALLEKLEASKAAAAAP